MVAGAGWGKSTLLAQWNDQDPHPERFRWLSLESRNNDPTRFWVYVLAALAPLGEGLSTVSARLLSAPGTILVDDVVPAVINELTAVTDPVTLVLDDYHLIRCTPRCAGSQRWARTSVIVMRGWPSRGPWSPGVEAISPRRTGGLPSPRRPQPAPGFWPNWSRRYRPISP